MDDGSIWFWTALIGYALTCTTATAARALRGFSRSDLLDLAERDHREDRYRQVLTRHESIAWALEGAECILAVATVVASVFYATADQSVASPGRTATVVGTAALALLLGQIWIARSVARIWPEVVVFRLWPVWTAMAALLTPISKVGRGVDVVLHRLAGKTPALPDEESLSEEIRSIVSEGERSGALEEDAKEMIERIITLGEVLAAEIMRPRTEMICMAESLSWDEMLEFVVHCGHSRIPVYRTNRDDIVGILYAKDLLPEISKRRGGDPGTPWPKLLRKPMFVPETKPVDALLEDFQRTHNHMAIVLDEYGGVAGLVTLEDIIEEIVGEIVDEFDTDEVAGIQRLNGNSAEVLGNVRVDELNREFRIDLPEGPDFDTVAGLIMSRLGHVPVPKESVEVDGVRLTVLDATPRRVNKVLVEVLDE